MQGGKTPQRPSSQTQSTKFLGVHITNYLTWTTNTISLVKNSQQHLHFLCRMRTADRHPSALTTFHRDALESILTCNLSVWYGSCSAAYKNVAKKKTLQRVVRITEKIIRSPQPSIKNIYTQLSIPHQICTLANEFLHVLNGL